MRKGRTLGSRRKVERKWSQRRGSGEEDMAERRVGRGGALGKRDLKAREWEERAWIGEMGETM